MTRTGLFWVMILSLLLGTLYASCGSRVFHTLENRPAWVSTKPTLERRLMGSVAFVNTPMALHRDALNLGAWHGFQEVFWKQPLPARAVRFRFRLADAESYLSFLYNRTGGTFSELRLSRNPLHPSQWSRVESDREYSDPQRVNGFSADGNWHEAEAIFQKDGMTFAVDGQVLFESQERLERLQEVGFRGGYQPSYIDDVEFFDPQDGVIASDDFSLQHSGVAIVLATLLLIGLGQFVGWRRSRLLPPAERPRAAFQAALLLYLVLLVVSVPFAWVEKSFLSGRHGYSALHFRVWKWITRPERPSSSYVNAIPYLQETWADSAPEGAERILLVGTSQTWGSGASRWEGDLAHGLASNLGESLAPRRFEVINGGISGRRSDFIFPYYEKEWIDWGADTAVINFGNNDDKPEVFEQTLEKFIQLNRDRGINTVLVLEANYPEARSDQLKQNHEIIRAAARRHGLPLVDLHGSLLNATGDGQVWWDFVHLTDYGQRRAAQVLGDALVPLLSESPAPR